MEIRVAAGPSLDITRYDSRGCMAPTAVFTTADPRQLATALVPIMQQMEQRTPRGEVEPAYDRSGVGVWSGPSTRLQTGSGQRSP